MKDISKLDRHDYEVIVSRIREELRGPPPRSIDMKVGSVARGLVEMAIKETHKYMLESAIGDIVKSQLEGDRNLERDAPWKE